MKLASLISLFVLFAGFTSPDPSCWLKDSFQLETNQQHYFKMTGILGTGETPFQHYLFANSLEFGKLLYIDGELQSSQRDEHIYHESLIHPAMIVHPNPKSVLVIGAGEGATAREILRYPSVQRLVLIDIDAEIIQHIKTFLPEWHQGSFDNPKVDLKIMDGKEFVQKSSEKFDVIVIDVCDKLSDNSVIDLYTPEFYQAVKKILTPSGILVVQSMEMDINRTNKDQLHVYRNLKTVFSQVSLYGVFVPSFWAIWGFTLATDDVSLIKTKTPEKIDLRLKKLGLDTQLRHYDGLTDQHMFSLPKTVRTTLRTM
jgi:spermidine synthase